MLRLHAASSDHVREADPSQQGRSSRIGTATAATGTPAARHSSRFSMGERHGEFGHDWLSVSGATLSDPAREAPRLVCSRCAARRPRQPPGDARGAAAAGPRVFVSAVPFRRAQKPVVTEVREGVERVGHSWQPPCRMRPNWDVGESFGPVAGVAPATYSRAAAHCRVADLRLRPVTPAAPAAPTGLPTRHKFLWAQMDSICGYAGRHMACGSVVRES
jgi:hypothetical protein